MYFTATSAASRYSGNVTGPDSMLSRPTTMGSPDAFFGVPRAAAASGVFSAVVVEPPLDEEDALESLSSPPQPATRSPAATIAARVPVRCLLVFMVLLMGDGQAVAATAAS